MSDPREPEATRDNREAQRKTTYAKLLINGIPGYIRNVSSNGIGAEFMMPPGLRVGDLIELEVHPEEETGLGATVCSAEVKWIKNEPPYFHVGLTSLPGDEEARELFERLSGQYQ
jgi:hypothetical protein